MEVLPDIVGADPVIVFCGMAGAESTKNRDHYYASPGNNFWECVHLSGLTPRRLRPEEDRTVDRARARADRPRRPLGPRRQPRLGRDRRGSSPHVERWEPAFLAFTAKGTAAYAARALGHRAPGLGLAPWGIGRLRGLRAARAPAAPTSARTTTAARTGSRGGASWPRSWRRSWARATPPSRDRRAECS